MGNETKPLIKPYKFALITILPSVMVAVEFYYRPVSDFLEWSFNRYDPQFSWIVHEIFGLLFLILAGSVSLFSLIYTLTDARRDWKYWLITFAALFTIGAIIIWMRAMAVTPV